MKKDRGKTIFLNHRSMKKNRDERYEGGGGI